MTKSTLVILRHGQTEYNKQKLMTGQRDVPLTEKGEEQARLAGQLFSVIRFDKVYSSPLSRAFNTAALALEAAKTEEHLRLPDGTWQIEQRQEIIELDTGIFTGRCHKTDPEILEQNKNRSYDRPLPGGESAKQVVERLRKFYEDDVVPRLERGENVLIVAHSGIVGLFDIAAGLEQPPPDGSNIGRRHVDNAAPTVYEYEDGSIRKVGVLAPPPANGNVPPPKKQPKLG